VSTSNQPELKPYDSPDGHRTEVYRGIQVEVIYCYLVHPTITVRAEETLGWRILLPNGPGWLDKFATPDEAFLKARQIVDERLQQGTLGPQTEEERTSGDEADSTAKTDSASSVAADSLPEATYEPAIKTDDPAQFWRKRLFVALLITAILLFGWRTVQNALTKSPASDVTALQPFDEHLSLNMPVAFGAVAEIPTYQFPSEVQTKILRATMRNASFANVYLTVAKITFVPGSNDFSIQGNLTNAFEANAYRSTRDMPEISWHSVAGTYESGMIRFPVVVNNQQGQEIGLDIQADSDGTVWCITVWGPTQTAELAEKTAREFVFK
jgi:hypothetical protein